MTEKTKEEQAVIDAAEAYFARLGVGNCDLALSLLQESVAALRASLKPKGMRPEDVEPGTLFRFADVGDVEQPVHKMIFDGDNPERRMFISAEGDNCALGFWEGVRIIPIEEDGECEHINASWICQDCGESGIVK